MERRGDEYDASARIGVRGCVGVFFRGCDEVRDRGFEGVVGADGVDVDHCFERVG